MKAQDTSLLRTMWGSGRAGQEEECKGKCTGYGAHEQEKQWYWGNSLLVINPVGWGSWEHLKLPGAWAWDDLLQGAL